MAVPADTSYAGVLKLIIDEGLIEPTVTYADVSSCMLFVWDYFLTFDMEVRLVWKSRWNAIKIIFLLQRYMPFIDACYLTLYRQLAFRLSVQECKMYSYVAAFIYITGIFLSEVLLTSRVWALWNRDKRLGIIFSVILCGIFAGAYFAVYIYVTGLQYTDFPLPGFDFQGCFIIGANNAVIWCWAGLMAWNSVTLTLMLIPGIQAYQSGVSSRLTNVIYRDGVYYYVYLFILSSLNIVFASTLPGQKRVMVTLLERNMHSMLASRVLLHMRETSTDSSRTLQSWNISQARSADFAIGGKSYDGADIALSPLSQDSQYRYERSKV